MMASPLGDLLLAGEGEVLELIGFPEGKGEIRPGQDWVLEQNMLRNAVCQLNEYFEGRRKDFTLNLKPSGTPFQLSVLAALEQIPYGQTRTYAEIARQIGRPKAVRAVGAANGRNPLPIVIPCHRVIGSDGSLTGFGGGIAAKQYLLSLETAEFQLC
ncbi:MAG: methylated-DNA--[protein]-cysteine S-methyltransferase [Gammaproteobacteria bacterium]